MTSQPPEESRFPNTRWTLVLQAQKGGERTHAAAMASLCETYWRPIYVFIRGGTDSAHDAEDLTQGFFADLLGREFLSELSADRGRFRCFLLASAKNYLAKQRRRAEAKKRGGGIPPLAFDFGELEALLASERDPPPPDLAYDRQWALTLLESVLRSLDHYYQDSGRGELFEALSARVLHAGAPAPSYAEIAARLGMEESAVKTAAHRMRKRYRELLREAVADTVLNPHEVEAELEYLIEVFG